MASTRKKRPEKAQERRKQDKPMVTLAKGEKTLQLSYWQRFSPYLEMSEDLKAAVPVVLLLLSTAPAVPKKAYPAIEKRLKGLMEVNRACQEPRHPAGAIAGDRAHAASQKPFTTSSKRTRTVADAAARSSKPTSVGAILAPLMNDLAKRRKD